MTDNNDKRKIGPLRIPLRIQRIAIGCAELVEQSGEARFPTDVRLRGHLAIVPP